jgi:hypothetical protein
MSQRTIISETERERILKMHNKAKSYHMLKEDESMEDPNRQIIRGVQRFLNEKMPSLKLVVDGKTGSGSKTEAAISKYQSMIGVSPSDGVWGRDTWEKMPPKDQKRLKWFIADEGGLMDKFFNWIGLD